MDPAFFKKSTLELHHDPYGPLMPEKLAGANKGKVAVVTGAGRGIGRAIAEALASSGADLATLDLDVERQAETKAACDRFGVKVIPFACNVADLKRVTTVFGEIKDQLGPVDILVNNAGTNAFATVDKQPFEQFWDVIETNLKGPMACIWQVINDMRTRQSGCIISIASRAATVDVPANLSYCASKAAVARAVSTLQEELEQDGLGDKIHTYSLHPGGVWTSMAQTENAPSEEFRHLFKDSPSLCGSTCAYLATGKAKAIRGMYFDCRQDVERVCGVGRKELLAKRIGILDVGRLEGYENEP